MIDRILRKLPLERLSRRDRALALKAIEAEAARERAENERRRAAIERLSEQHRQAVRGLVSEQQARELAVAARREQLALRGLRRTPGSDPRDVERAVREGRKRLGRHARELRVDLARLRDLGAARARRLSKLTDPAEAGVTAGRVKFGFMDTAGAPPHLDPPDAVVYPPFLFGVQYHHSDTSDDFTVDLDWEIDESIGRITTRSRMRCPDAGFWNDYATGWVEADLVFVYTAPATGRLSAVVEATNLEGTSRVSLENEFGFSSSETHLRNYMTLRVYHPATPGESFAEMSHLESRGTDGSTSENRYYPGSTYLATLESNGTVEAGDTFFVAVGTRNSDRSVTDDVSVETSSDFSWVIRSIELRMLGGDPVIPVVGRARKARRTARR